MQSANLFFSVPLFKKNVSRFWPLWSLYTLVLFLMLPFHFLSTDPTWFSMTAAEHFTEYVMQIAVNPAIPVLYGVFVAMAVWSYLYNPRSVSAIHALPLRRETIFVTNYITGLLFFLVPSLLIFLLSLLCQSIAGGVTLLALGMWLLCQSLMMLFFFSFATLLAFVTGHILALPVLYGIFNGLFFGLYFLLNQIFSEFVYGYGFGSNAGLTWIGEKLTPVYGIIYWVQPRMSRETFRLEGAVHNMHYLWAYAIAGLVMAVLALLLYRKRKLELAGEVIAVSWLRPVFKYGVGICGALAFGYISYGMFAGSGNLPGGFWSVLLFILLWGAISYLATAMLIRKSFRVLKLEAKGCGILLLVLLVSMAAMEWDVFGVERRVPAPESIEYVFVRSGGFYTPEQLESDPDFIENVLAFHTTAVAAKDDVAYWTRELWDKDYYSHGLVEDCDWGYIHITYQLKSGAQLRRAYSIPIMQTLLEDETSLAYAYNELINEPAYRAAGILPADLERDMLYQAKFGNSMDMEMLKDYHGETAQNWNNYTFGNYYFTKEEALRLYDAAKADLQAGNMGRDYLTWRERERMEIVGELQFSFQTAPGHTETHLLTLSKESAETLAVLEEIGLQRGVDLLTWREYYAIENKYHDYDVHGGYERPETVMPELAPAPGANELPPEEMNPNSSDIGSSF